MEEAYFKLDQAVYRKYFKFGGDALKLRLNTITNVELTAFVLIRTLAH